MQILQLISSSGFYGAEGVVLSLSCGLQQLGCDVTLGVFNADSPENTDLCKTAQMRSIKVWNMPCRRKVDVGALARLIHRLRQTDTTVIHTHGYKADVYGYLASRFTYCRSVATCHNWTNRTSALKGYGSIDKLFLRHFNQVVAVSDNVLSIMEESGLKRSEIALICNGVDTAHFRGEGNQPQLGEPFRIGALSRLSPEKGIDILVRAFPLILRRFPGTTCVIAGEGPERNKLTALANDLGVGDAIEFRGFCPDTAKFLSTCTVVAHPSRMDGMPLAILEAMASGRPIVASEVGDIPKLFNHGESGLLVRPGDPDALGFALIHLLENATERTRIATAAQTRAQKLYDASVMAHAYFTLYQQCTDEAFSLAAQKD